MAVSSTADIFPLPHAQPLPNSVIDASLLNETINGDETGTGTGGGGILWDNSKERANGIDAGLGSDESLGGALLTPIPWLKDGGLDSTDICESTTNDPDDEMLVVPDRADGAVTQGELIRQEQEAGVIPVASVAGQGPSRMMSGAVETGSDDVMQDEELEEAIPHARGPEMVGTVDMGLVGGRGVEVSIDSGEQRLQEDKTGVVSDAQMVLEQGTPKEDEDMLIDAVISEDEADNVTSRTDSDGDAVLVDVGDKTGEERKTETTGENVGPDASDSTTR